MKTSFNRRWLAVLLSLLLVSACYGSTTPVVKIGLIAPFEELYREDGYAVLHAVQLAVNQRNAAGGVAGRQVALVALNDNGRPDEAAFQASKLALDADLLAVISPAQLATAAAAGATLDGAVVPWVSLAPLDASQLGDGFGLAASPAALGEAAAAALASQVGSLVIFSDQSEAVQAVQQVGAASGLLVDGLSLADALRFSPDAGQGLIWLGDAAAGAGLAEKAAGEVSLVGGPELGSPVFAGRAGDAALAVRWMANGPSADEMPASFVEGYRSLNGSDPGPLAVLAYDAANLLLDAMEQAGAGRGPLDRGAVQQVLRDLGSTEWLGLSGAVSWDGQCSRSGSPCQRDQAPLVWRDVAAPE